MRNRLYKLGAVIFILVLATVVFWPVSHWRLYDALWHPLALTQAENWCSGMAVAEQNYSESAQIAPGCEESSGMENETPSITNSVTWACQGINSVNGWAVADCVNDVEGYQIWFLQGGGWTNDWSEARPRPVEVVIAPDAGRGENRGDFDSPTTTTTESEDEE